MLPIRREFSATVEFDGEEFSIVLHRTETSAWTGYRHREEYTVYVDAADLPDELVRDLQDEYTAEEGDAEDFNEGADRIEEPSADTSRAGSESAQ